MSDRPAKPDFVALHIALARRALAGEKIDDEPTELFPDDDDLDAAIERHPSNANGPDAA